MEIFRGNLGTPAKSARCVAPSAVAKYVSNACRFRLRTRPHKSTSYAVEPRLALHASVVVVTVARARVTAAGIHRRERRRARDAILRAALLDVEHRHLEIALLVSAKSNELLQPFVGEEWFPKPRSAALLALVCVTPGYCAATGAAGRSYFGIIVQPDDTSAATKSVNVNLYIVSCPDIYSGFTHCGCVLG